jgi:activating signal cointegrator 1
MKALSLTQPWATLVALREKSIETRSWPTPYRGPLAIHAAKNLKPVGGLEGLKDLCQTPPFCDALVRAGIAFAGELPLGAVVAICRLAYCVPVEEVDAIYSPSRNERAFGDYSDGRFAWFLGDIVALPEPIPARGGLGLWDWDAPAEVLALMEGR